jgi:N-acetylglucosaminyl-diphospho-decaprenol L-rhamnosyltransferase
VGWLTTAPAAAGRAAIDVVVVTFNSAGVIAGLLDSLPTGMSGLDWRLIVVDNGSRDSTLELVCRHPTVAEIVELPVNGGFAAGVNRGLVETDRDRAVLILNPDVRLAARCARRLHAALESDAGAGIVVPRLVDERGQLLWTLRHEPSAPRALAEALVGVRLAARLGCGETIRAPGAYSRSTVAEWASGAVLMISRDCLRICGSLEESFFLYSEDTEYQLRARDRGLRTRLAPDALATHIGGDSLTDPELWTLLVLNKVELRRRRSGCARGLAFWISSVVREVRFALTGNRPSARAARALLEPRRAQALRARLVRR